MSDDLHTDVAVVGGGPAATATAITLLDAGLDVVVVAGRDRAPVYRPGEGAPPGTDRTVHQVFGSAAAFDPDAHLPSYENRSAWGSDEFVTTDFMFNPFGPGWHLDREAFDRRLLDTVAVRGGRVLRDTDVAATRHADPEDAGEWALGLVTADTPRCTLRARFACDASGRSAVVARRHGGIRTRSDCLVGLASVLEPDSEDRDPATTIEAVENGWWYTARLPRRRRVAIFFTDSDLLDLAGVRTAEAFDALASATTHVRATLRRCRYRHCIRPIVVGAGGGRLASPVGAGWIAVGDAAMTFDPLSSQGVLTALLMGREAGRTAARWCAATGDRVDACARYAATYEQVAETYRREYRTYYGAEQRWCDSPFWSRRRLAFAHGDGSADPGHRPAVPRDLQRR